MGTLADALLGGRGKQQQQLHEVSTPHLPKK